LIASGVPNSAMNIDTAADNRTVFTGRLPLQSSGDTFQVRRAGRLYQYDV
jgi:hypothetical protein